MNDDYLSRGAFGIRPLVFFLLACAIAWAGQVQAMWARMSDAELIQKSQWIVVGEWVGQAPLRLGQGGAASDLGVIALTEVLRGPQGPTLAFVAVPGAAQPISSSDLRYRRGDHGVWFLRLRQPGDVSGPYLADHPQRFLRDTPENASVIRTLRDQLKR